jgi:hypothetical protein
MEDILSAVWRGVQDEWHRDPDSAQYLECQYEARSAEYQERADIKANLKRAELVRRRKAKGYPAESVVYLS